LRRLAVGGIDMSHAYERLGCGDDAVVLDIGCGTGDALKHLRRWASYVGIDTDPRAIEYATERWKGRANVRFECRRCTREDMLSLAPSHVALIGLLHHLDDADAVALLRMLRESPRFVRAVTLDIVYLPGHPFNNMMARFDRGRYCRTRDGYEKLAVEAGMTISDRYLRYSHPKYGLVHYFVLELVAAH
jgi:SAM-dependent methyltransferase